METAQTKIFTRWTFGKSALTGLFLWSILFFMVLPEAKSEAWARLMLALAAMVWLPLACQLIFQNNRKQPEHLLTKEILRHAALPAGSLFSIALFLPDSLAGIILTIPWAVLVFIIFKLGLKQLSRAVWSKPGDLAIIVACLLLPVGVLWALADRLNIQPLGFDPAIVFLTAVHFHYAGFLLLVIMGAGMNKFPAPALMIACYLAVISVPLTAIGITCSHLWQHFLLEAVAAIAVVVAGFAGAVGYLKIVLEEKIKGWAATLWGIMAVSLILSMTLAFLYAIRPWCQVEWVNIPWMRAWHGTVNALGVVGCGLVGWWFFRNENRAD